VPVAVVDQDASQVTKSIVEAMRADSSFDLREVSEEEAIALVRTGKVRAAAVLPKGFGEAAPNAMFRPRAKKPEIAVHYDPSQAVALSLVRGLLAEHVMKGVSRAAMSPERAMRSIDEVTDPALRRDLSTLFDSLKRVQVGDGSGAASGFSMPFETTPHEVTGPRGRNYNGYAHSFAGMGVQFILFMGIELGVGLLLMRRMGLWKRLRAAPISRNVLIGSRVVSGTLIALLLLVGIYAAGILVFGVRIDGSIVGFALVALAFAILTSSFGLLIAALGKTPEAARGLAILATLMLVMLGGAWVPTFVFPDWLQTATLVVPTRWAVDGFEAMTWRGLGLEAIWLPVLGMLACSALFAWIAMKRFAWEE
jgi:ABC-2 type transport system permease protein